MNIVKDKEVVISRGYRLEVSKKHEDELELVFYQNGNRSLVDSESIVAIRNFQDAWRFIERQLGSSIDCDFTEEAVKKIFGK